MHRLSPDDPPALACERPDRAMAGVGPDCADGHFHVASAGPSTSGQLILGLPMSPHLHIHNPAPTDGFETSEYTRPEQVTELLQALETHLVPLMILPSAKQYPRSPGLPSDHLGPFRDSLCRNYSLTRTLATGDEVWERRDFPTNCPPQ